MATSGGLRERKKQRTREHLADVAARLFAERGFEAVSVADVARAAEVSDQTVYNYFPDKHELVLDRVDEIRERYGAVVAGRQEGVTPAGAVRALVDEDIERYRGGDLLLARGEFPALCVQSPVLRRFALEFRERQTDTVAGAILATDPGVPPLVARAHSAALISVVQSVIDRIGAHVIAGTDAGSAADGMAADARVALDDLDRHFRSIDTSKGSS